MLIDPLKNLPGYALRRASLAVMAELARRLAKMNLRPTEASVLVVIEANPGITQSEVGQLLEIARANMTPLAARLLDRDLIVRSRVDGRSHGIRLSAAGRQLTRKARQAMAENEAALLGRIPRADHAAFLQALRALWIPEEVGSAPTESATDQNRAKRATKMRIARD
jgi:DNA-binding MarR family transcriptional regulator